MKFSSFFLTFLILMLAACSSSPAKDKPMLLKARYVYTDSVESASYCLLKSFEEAYKTLDSAVKKTDKGYDIQLKNDKKLVEIISMTQQGDDKAIAEVFLREGNITTQSWIDRTSRAALSCKGKMIY